MSVIPAWSWTCKSRSLLKTRKEFVRFLSGNNCLSTRLQTADIRVLWGWWGWWLRAMSEWVGGWVHQRERLTHHWWRSGDKQLREVIGWVVRCGQGKPTSRLSPRHWDSLLRGRVGVCGPAWPPYQQQDVLVFCFPCTRVLTRACKHKWNSALPCPSNLDKCLVHKGEVLHLHCCLGRLALLLNVIFLSFVFFNCTTVSLLDIFLHLLWDGRRSELNKQMKTFYFKHV